MCYKAVHRCFFVFDSIGNQYKTQKICDRFVSLYPQCDEVADDSVAALKLILDWFVTSKMI